MTITPSPPKSPKLLDQIRQACRLRHFSRRTEETYVNWARRFILHHGKRHPSELGGQDVTAFLADLADHRQVSASTQNQALCALLFLYRAVLRQPLPDRLELPQPRQSTYLPVVLTRTEVRSVLAELSGGPHLVASLLYGSGMRLCECLQLRVKDLDFERSEITIRQGKGRKDRVTVLPATLSRPLQLHLEIVRDTHRRDLAAGFGHVVLPNAFGRKSERFIVSTTMIYTHVLNRGGRGVRSPADRL